MAVAYGSEYFGRSSVLDPADESIEEVKQAKASLIRSLSRSATYWVGLFQEAARTTSDLPATMLREVDFDDSTDAEVAHVRFRSVEESIDMTW